MKIVFRPAAAADVEDAYLWYRDKRAALGSRFVAAVREAGARIKDNPQASPMFLRDTRRIRLKRFPYSLLYRVYPDKVVVVACFHGRRDPRKWARRVDG